MFVIEVQPRRAWRPLKWRGSVAKVTRHSAASHYFLHSTAESILRVTERIEEAGRELDLARERQRISECPCSPLALMARRRRRRL